MKPLRSRFHPTSGVCIAVVTVAVVVACGHDTATTGMQMPEIKIPSGADYTAADVGFMQGMIHHHAQAITMAAMSPTHGASAPVKMLSKKIDISQRDEISMMKTWLDDRHQAVPDPNEPHARM